MTLFPKELTIKANRGHVAPSNPIGGMRATRLTKFLSIYIQEFYGLRVEEYPNGVIDEVYKVLPIMGLSSIEEAELAAYQLKDVAQIMYEKWKDRIPIGAVPIELETFKLAYLDRFFPRELRKASLEEV